MTFRQSIAWPVIDFSTSRAVPAGPADTRVRDIAAVRCIRCLTTEDLHLVGEQFRCGRCR